MISSVTKLIYFTRYNYLCGQMSKKNKERGGRKCGFKDNRNKSMEFMEVF